MASRSPSRSPSRDPAPAHSRSPRRSITPRSASRSPVRNGHRNGSDSRSRSRGRSPTMSRSRSRTPRARSPPRSAKIVVEKLTKNVNEGHLREIFGNYGPLKEIDMPMNRQFQTNRRTAYIMYEDMADAEAAIAHMHEAQLDGAILNVSIVLPKRRFSKSPPLSRRVESFNDRERELARPPPPARDYRDTVARHVAATLIPTALARTQDLDLDLRHGDHEVVLDRTRRGHRRVRGRRRDVEGLAEEGTVDARAHPEAEAEEGGRQAIVAMAAIVAVGARVEARRAGDDGAMSDRTTKEIERSLAFRKRMETDGMQLMNEASL